MIHNCEHIHIPDGQGAAALLRQHISRGTYSWNTEGASAPFHITAPQDQIEAIKTDFTALLGTQEAFCEAALEFDNQSMDVVGGTAMVSAIRNKLQSDMAALASYTGSDRILSSVLGTYTSVINSLDTLFDGNYQSTVDFSSKIKYTQLYITHEYAMLLNQLTQGNTALA